MADAHRLNVCFHGIGVPGPEIPAAAAAYWIPTSTFLTILDDVSGWPDAAVSFDDGCPSDVEIALPALRERGLAAAFFVLAGRLDLPGSVSTADVQMLAAEGMIVGTHGMDHIPWRQLDEATRHREFVEARARIAEVVGVPVDHAALPLGRYDRSTLAQLRRAGYRRVYTSDRRLAREHAWLQPRFSVRADDTRDSLRATAAKARRLSTRLTASSKGLVKRLR